MDAYIPPEMHSTLAYGVAGVAGLYLLVRATTDFGPKLDFLPTVGPSAPLISYLGAFRYVFNAKEMFQEGYEKFPKGVFRVALIDRWSVLVSGKQMVEDIANAREEDMSFHQSTNEFLQTRYTLGRGIERDPYHPAVIRTSLSRNVGSRFPDIRDEIVCAFGDLLPLTGDEWLVVPAYDSMMRIIARTSNRMFVGLPLCRNEDYLALNIGVAMDVVVKAQLINFLPAFLRPTLGPLISLLRSNMRRASKHLTPLVAERLKQVEMHGKDWPEKPNDLISWLIDYADGDELKLEALVQRVIFINFAAIRTSTDTFVHMLYDLVANQSYIEPLREEIQAIVSEEGWTRASVGKMYKLDSFLRESQRLHGIGTQSLGRKVIKPEGFTFSDGTHLPTGTYVHATTWSLHHDPELYPDPHQFDGFRFWRMRDAADQAGSAKYAAVTTNLDYLAFGHGVHACPGRHFAAVELKAILAHILLNYEFKFEEGREGRPENQGSSSHQCMLLLDLHDDLLLCVLSDFLDVPDVLNLRKAGLRIHLRSTLTEQKTCKRLEQLTRDNTVWRALLARFRAAGDIPLPPGASKHAHAETPVIDAWRAEERWTQERQQRILYTPESGLTNEVVWMEVYLDRWLLVAFVTGLVKLWDGLEEYATLDLWGSGKPGRWRSCASCLVPGPERIVLALSCFNTYETLVYQVQLGVDEAEFEVLYSTSAAAARTVRAIDGNRELVVLSSASMHVLDVLNWSTGTTRSVLLDADEQDDDLFNSVLACKLLNDYFLVVRTHTIELHSSGSTPVIHRLPNAISARATPLLSEPFVSSSGGVTLRALVYDAHSIACYAISLILNVPPAMDVASIGEARPPPTIPQGGVQPTRSRWFVSAYAVGAQGIRGVWVERESARMARTVRVFSLPRDMNAARSVFTLPSYDLRGRFFLGLSPTPS
ncbi:Cytochrome P450 [Mycena kentingensis (nom. inval.)]|nr:Cytochrome P450 [Mycena kentingensis (nom. inval.)]